MTLPSYLSRKYFRYFLVINGGLVLLYNVIAFFERYRRFSDSPLSAILTFVSLNVLPSFFRLIPLSCWLATCFILKDLALSNEWDAMHMLHVGPKSIVKIVAILGGIISLGSFVGKEVITYHLSRKLEQYKAHMWGDRPMQELSAIWLSPDKDTFAHIGTVNLETNKGEDIIITRLDSAYGLKQIIRGDTFSLKPNEKTLLVHQPRVFSPENIKSTVLEAASFHMPGLFAQLCSQKVHPSLIDLGKSVATSRNFISKQTYTHELLILLGRLLSHLEPFLLILFGFCWFFAWYNSANIRWIGPILSYPLLLAVSALCAALAMSAQMPFIALLPYTALLFITVLCAHHLA